MANMVRAALLQAAWTGDRESMVEKGAHYAYEAADRGAQVMCFQELFNGPYFCQVQDDDHGDSSGWCASLTAKTTPRSRCAAQVASSSLIPRSRFSSTSISQMPAQLSPLSSHSTAVSHRRVRPRTTFRAGWAGRKPEPGPQPASLLYPVQGCTG